jgi:hypothetical protein
MKPEEYFEFDKTINKKRYDALRDFFVNKQLAADVANILFTKKSCKAS